MLGWAGLSCSRDSCCCLLSDPLAAVKARARQVQLGAHHRRARARHHRQLRARLDSRRARVRVGVAAALLLGARARRADRAPVHRRVRLRLRVHGPQRSARHHAAHRSYLPDADASAQYEAGRCASWTGRNWQDRDDQGSGQGARSAVCRHQLRRGHGLPGKLNRSTTASF